jgi:predicted dehydrogenase
MSLKAAVIGTGYLGKFHAEKYSAIDNVELVAVVDADLSCAKKVAKKLKCEALDDYHQILDQIDCVSIVVPTQKHFEVAKDCLSHGKHVLLEKPMTVTVEEADELIKIAKDKNVHLQIGHLERFNPAVQALQDTITNPRFIESQRIASFNLRGSDVNVMLDLMIHDIDIIQSLVNSPIKKIDANGARVISDKVDIANARITFENGCVANVTASRVSIKTERKMRIFQSDAYVSLDLQEKIARIYRRGGGEPLLGIPNVKREKKSFAKADALLSEVQAFVESIIENKPVVVSGEDGRRSLETAIKITEMVQSQDEW